MSTSFLEAAWPGVYNGHMPKPPSRPSRTRLLLVVPLWAAVGCAGGEPVTPPAIARSKRTWEEAGIRNYTLEWTTTGPRYSRYRVTVRAGKVKRVDPLLPHALPIQCLPAHPTFP